MAFWNRNDDWRRRDGRDDRDQDYRRDDRYAGARDARDWGYGEGMGVRTERGPNDGGEWARERYGVGEYGTGYGRPDDRFGFGRHERERGMEGRYSQDRNQEGRWGGGSYYGQADYGIGLGGWREQGRAMMDAPRHRSEAYRADMPGMGSRGDYGMDDYRTRQMSQDWGRSQMDRDQSSGGRGGRTYGLREGGYATQNYGTSERQLGGRGPKNYTRSDDRIREDVCERLMASWMNSEDVDVAVQGGEVTLTGHVDNRHEKRAIEDLVEMVLGVKEVHNHLRVRSGLMAKLGVDASRDEARNVNSAGVMAAGTGHELRSPTGRTTGTATTTNTGGDNRTGRA